MNLYRTETGHSHPPGWMPAQAALPEYTGEQLVNAADPNRRLDSRGAARNRIRSIVCGCVTRPLACSLDLLKKR